MAGTTEVAGKMVRRGLILQVGAKVGCGSGGPQVKLVRGACASSRENEACTNSQC